MLDCNKSFASGFDKDPIGSNINELLTIIDSETNITALVKKAKIIQELEAKYTTDNGDRISFLINLSYVESASGKHSYEIIGTAINITKRKQAEMLILLQNEKLKKHIANQATHELELEKMTHDLLRYNNELEHFAYITSHNLRAPVVNMVMLQNLYNSSQPEDPENTEIMEKMRSSILKLNETISDLTDVVALKKDPRGSKSVFSVYTAVKEILKSIESQVLKAGARVEFLFDESLKVNVDRSHFTNIVLNLLTNAIRYKHPDRDVVIQISASKSDGFMVLGIHDNGLGLDLIKTKGKLFDLYQRFHPEIEGKGLGLYLVKSQIEGLGGMINVQSEVNIGSTFRIYFPD